jgi:periplasmic protein TonB
MKKKAKGLDAFLFDGKNRQYGAFVLRQKSTIHGLLSTLLGMGALLGLYSLPLVWASKSSEPLRQVEVHLTPFAELVAPPSMPPEPQTPKVLEMPPSVATKRFVRPELRRDEEVVEEELIPTIEDWREANPGTHTREGSDDVYADYQPEAPVIKEEVTPPPPPPAPKKREVFSFVEKFPEFPGGEMEMLKFMAENIRYPSAASANNIQGLVVLQFTVDAQGRIEDITILKDIGGGCGDEAVRIVKSMPLWIPGEQNGLPVAVRYTLPVHFKLM